MQYINYDSKYQKQVYDLYCGFQKEEDFFKAMSYEEFCGHMFKNPFFKDEANFMALKDDEVVGFGGAIVKPSDDGNPNAAGYIHTFIVKKEYRRQGIGSKLLELCEEYIKSKGRKYSRLLFISPINWPWYIPNTDHHMHPGAPAIRINSDMYIFLYHHKYYVNSIHEGFHLPLSEYELPESVVKKMEENNKKGLFVEMYDPNKHYGVEEFCQKVATSEDLLAEIEREEHKFDTAEEILTQQFPDMKGKVKWPNIVIHTSVFTKLKRAVRMSNKVHLQKDILKKFSQVNAKRNDLFHGGNVDIEVEDVEKAFNAYEWLKGHL